MIEAVIVQKKIPQKQWSLVVVNDWCKIIHNIRFQEANPIELDTRAYWRIRLVRDLEETCRAQSRHGRFRANRPSKTRCL